MIYEDDLAVMYPKSTTIFMKSHNLLMAERDSEGILS